VSLFNKTVSAFVAACILLPAGLMGQTTASRKKSASTSAKSSTAKAGTSKGKSAKSKNAAKKHKKISPQRARRVNRAFKASEELRPMAQQLLSNRTPQAYAGVEAFAKKHAGTDSASLANLTLGYAHLLDKDYVKAMPSLAKAASHAGELADYVKFFQAQAYSGNGDQLKAIATLAEFNKNSQDSIFARDAVVIEGNALVANDRAAEAVKLLESNRLPTRADVELALGRAYLKTDNGARGMEILRRVYFNFPTSYEATQAQSVLVAQGSDLQGTYEDRRTRADLLARAGRWSDAAVEYRALTVDAPEAERGNMQVMLAAALRKTGNTTESTQLLQSANATGEYNARRLYLLGEIARSNDDEPAIRANLDRMLQESTTSVWYQQALKFAGDWYLIKKDYDHAIDMYREVALRFPQGGNLSAYAHWKSAWLTYRQNRLQDAKKAFEEQVQLFPNGNETPAALYWRAKIAEGEGDTALARTWYVKCAQRYRSYYYGVLAAKRLAKIPGAANEAAEEDARLAKIPPITNPSEDAVQTEAPADDLRVEKAKLLLNAGLVDFAVRELQAADGGQGANWATLEIARVYTTAGMYHRALQSLKRAVPNYYSLEISQLPRPYWEFLFPTPYWPNLRREAEANGLNPYLVASLIRQESEFNPSAVSHANAYGLMQLLPGVGKGMAHEVKLRGFSTDRLLEPSVNLQLGTRYFKEMVNQYNGQVEYALAAYNAGTNRVADWQQNGTYKDIDEFVESIPFTETREYVQAITRNASLYKLLYPQAE
jgi:soluble lytic murein transglycosylase